MTIEWRELQDVVKNHVLKLLEAQGVSVVGGEFDFKIRIVQEQEGSPRYHVDRWKVQVDAVADLPNTVSCDLEGPKDGE